MLLVIFKSIECNVLTPFIGGFSLLLVRNEYERKAWILLLDLLYYSLSLRRSNERTKEIKKSSCNRIG